MSDQINAKEIIVHSINHLPVNEQDEILADNMSSVRNEYEPLQNIDIVVPYFSCKCDFCGDTFKTIEDLHVHV